ncbi:MAG: DUF6438 domain-containing protein [Bacteroidota bacterium]|nr:DUF6438 domain-containing protein [Bacteroidota bacterium]
MKKIKLIYLILLIITCSCNGQTNKSSETDLNRISTKYRNKIDNIISAKDIELLISTVDKRFNDFKVNESLKFSDKESQLFCDSLKIKPWIKADFDGNGYNDLLVVGNWGDHAVICLMDSGENKFYIKRITRRSFQDCTFPIVQVVGQTPVIINYSRSEPDWKNHKTDRLLIRDTLVFQFGDFVEFNSMPAKHTIEKIEYSTGPCFGTCPIFEMTINSNRKATFKAQEYNKVKGNFSSIIDTLNYNLLIHLLNYIDFVKLKKNYAVNWTDDQTCTLKITYDNGKIKEIRDYGLIGTFGLNRTYNILFKLRENQKWEK